MGKNEMKQAQPDYDQPIVDYRVHHQNLKKDIFV